MTIDNPRIAILGAGVSGICMAIKLKEAGFTNLVIYEKADRVGGTWRENTYPGVSCDVPTHLYSFSFAQNPIGQDYTPAAQTFRHILKMFQKNQALFPCVIFIQKLPEQLIKMMNGLSVSLMHQVTTRKRNLTMLSLV